MPHLNSVLRAAAATALAGSIACSSAIAGADPDNAPNDALTAALSKGYSTSNCSPQPLSDVSDAFPAAKAVDFCGQNADKTGPASARFVLYNNSADTTNAFNRLIGGNALVNCGSEHSPTSWHQGNTSDTAGQVACGTGSDQAEVIWTISAKNVLASVRAANGDTTYLFQWWQKYG